jgi:hypothetical protein
MSLQPLTCQFCGAALQASAQQNHVKCDFCGAELTVLVAERIEVIQQTHIPEAILLAEPLPAPPPPQAERPPPPAPVAAPKPERPRAAEENLDVPPWASRLLFRAIREIFRRR